MTPATRRALGTAPVLFGVAEAATMLLGRSILWRIVCGRGPASAVSDCLVPGVVRGAALLAAVGGVALLTLDS
ncbi:hypothetical protein [Halolamina sediminis]|uniref:hypothetical protein n=1 Tax=Halolamina sediminis TaxID=1480675 RepID=UPI0006B5DC83|nr:hypothetical protein [Halolamina sediminis]